MRNGFSVGRIFGIRITIDWSWIFIFVLVIWDVGTAVAQLHPAWGLATIWGVAVVAALLFFASVLAHELAHSLVARAQGLPVRTITLFLFGGVSNIQREPHSPGAEFLMAIVGPITSIVLGVIFSALGGVGAGTLVPLVGTPMAGFARLSPLTTILLWLGPINVLLGLFNLIPGFPLDGGRVLRSLLWAATNNLRTATRWASWVGQVIGWLMIIGGLAMIFGIQIPFFGTGFLGGLWLAFIGWFLNMAAIQSYRQLVIHDLLEGVPVARLMRTTVPTVPAMISISDLVHEYVMRTDERAFPVLQDGDHLAGLVCLDDVRKVPREDWETTRVQQIMTPMDQVAVVTPEEEAGEAFTILTGRDVNQVPVVQDGHLVGMLRRRDILTWLQLHAASF
jgi:Zn-dependent protease/predicted transcriptional regulator